MAPPAVWLRCAAFAGHSNLVFGSFGSSYARYGASGLSGRGRIVRTAAGMYAMGYL